MSETSYEENYTPDHDYSQDVCTPDDQPAAPQREINDPPIEYDPVGQALLTLPIAVFTGIGEVAMEGASVAGAVGKEVISWAASELGIGAAEHLTEDSPEVPEEPANDYPDASVPDASFGE